PEQGPAYYRRRYARRFQRTKGNSRSLGADDDGSSAHFCPAFDSAVLALDGSDRPPQGWGKHSSSSKRNGDRRGKDERGGASASAIWQIAPGIAATLLIERSQAGSGDRPVVSCFVWRGRLRAFDRLRQHCK